MAKESHKLAIIMNAQFIHEVQIAQGKLESEGIRSFLIDKFLPLTHATVYVEGYRLLNNTNDNS
jgi:hypothetical protein